MIKGYKKCLGGVLVELEIPDEATYVTPKPPVFDLNHPRKSRAEYAKVTKVHGGKVAYSIANPEFKYEEGCVVKPDSFDATSPFACGHGIHFFLNKEDAVNFEWVHV